eukprot:TRINITY_DN24319_c0_g1_i1.p1 TRINITY_DN24319_c0_g1~~TRINITY_DN24319_c0_g1_i1.p1  ORF type:complete len:311 (-),score=33.01 TRINITY_DN24319_c0_g1_i1:70-1002(-)
MVACGVIGRRQQSVPSWQEKRCYNCLLPSRDAMGKHGLFVLGGRRIAEFLYVPADHVGEFCSLSDEASERFWSRLPCVVPSHDEDGWVLRISYGGWIRHGPGTEHFHAHLHIEAPSLEAFDDAVSQLCWTDNAWPRTLPKVYPADPEADVCEFLSYFVPELSSKPFLEVVTARDFARRWRDALHALGFALGLEPGVGDGAALCVGRPRGNSWYTVRCSEGCDGSLRRLESRSPAYWSGEALDHWQRTEESPQQLRFSRYEGFNHKDYWKNFSGGEHAYWQLIAQGMPNNRKRKRNDEDQDPPSRWRAWRR